MWKSNSINRWCPTFVEVLLYSTFDISLSPEPNYVEKERESSLLNAQASQVSQSLRACEENLHGVIEGIAKDQILVRFSHIDKSNLKREFSFVIDVSSRVYRGLLYRNHIGCSLIRSAVPTSTPYLPTLPIMVDELNQSKDIYGFIKQVRNAFEELVQHR
jgi:kinetochore protein Spc25, fungi type